MTRTMVWAGTLAAGLWALLALQTYVTAGEPPREGRRRPAAEGDPRPEDFPAARGPREGDDRGPPREGRRGGDAERGPRPERDGPPPKPPRDGGPDRDGDRPPPKPPRDGDFDRPEGGPPPKPPRDGGPEGDQDRPPPKPPREGGFGMPGMRPPMGGERPGMGGGPERQRFRGGPPMDWEAMEKNDPEMFKLMREDMRLEQEAHELAMKLRQAPPDRRDAIKQEIRELVTKHFDVRQERRTMELKRLEKEISHVRESLEKRQSAKEQIIKQRVRELTGGEDDLTF